MLANIYRLTSKSDFDRVKEKGHLYQFPSFALSTYSRGDKEPPRFGFIVSTKISKAASVRNRIRRGLREGVRQNLAYIKKGHDCVYLAKPAIVKTYTDEIMKEVKRSLIESGLHAA